VAKGVVHVKSLRLGLSIAKLKVHPLLTSGLHEDVRGEMYINYASIQSIRLKFITSLKSVYRASLLRTCITALYTLNIIAPTNV
jgi:hypothetical protein